MKKISLLIISTASLAACGGGYTPEHTSEPPDGIVSLHGVAKACAASPTSKAKVSVPYGDDQAYDVTTNADGSYVVAVDTAKFNGVNPVAVTVQSDNCAPESVYVANLKSGVRDGKLDVPAAAMRDLAPAEFVIPPPWRPLTHLGDDQYGGPANSKLQVATLGLETTQPLGVITQQMKDQYKTAYVEFSARGMQTESQQCATYYDNKIGLTTAATASAGAVVKTVQPGASNPDGSFARFSIPIDLSEFPVGSTLNFYAGSGSCVSGGTDRDDFELTAVVVRFRN